MFPIWLVPNALLFLLDSHKPTHTSVICAIIKLSSVTPLSVPTTLLVVREATLSFGLNDKKLAKVTSGQGYSRQRGPRSKGLADNKLGVSKV